MAFFFELNILQIVGIPIKAGRFGRAHFEVFMNINERIERFLTGQVFAVVGASQDRSKYGNKVLRCYLQHGLKAYAVNPKETEIEGQVCIL